MAKVTVEIPDGDMCIGFDPRNPKKVCIFAVFSKKRCAYNCRLHGKLLRGEENPRRLKECMQGEKIETVI